MQDRIEAIRARCEAATPGPWKYDGMAYVWTDAFPMMMVADIRGWGYLTSTLGLSNEDASKQMDANAVFIAHSREDLSWALDRIAELGVQLTAYRTGTKKLKERIARLQDAVDRAQREKHQEHEALAEAQRRERAAVEDIKHLVFKCADDPLDLCGEVCANNDGTCQKGVAAGYGDKCHGFDWRGPQEAAEITSYTIDGIKTKIVLGREPDAGKGEAE